ncbi:MAG: GNAT family N-acetyltransferase [bacterium]
MKTAFLSIAMTERALGEKLVAEIESCGLQVLWGLGAQSPDDVPYEIMLQRNVRFIKQSDLFIAVLKNYGRDLAAEVGMAYAWGKPRFGIAFDARQDGSMVYFALEQIVQPESVAQVIRSLLHARDWSMRGTTCLHSQSGQPSRGPHGHGERDSMRVEIGEAPSPADLSAIRAGITEYNCAHTVPDEYRPLTVLARDGTGVLGGGLIGETFWQWLHISVLWVDEAFRCQGIGSRLLSVAEEQSASRGCRAAFVDTLSFQAPAFYTKHGYIEWGRINGLPPGHSRIFYKKGLDDRTRRA